MGGAASGWLYNGVSVRGCVWLTCRWKTIPSNSVRLLSTIVCGIHVAWIRKVISKKKAGDREITQCRISRKDHT